MKNFAIIGAAGYIAPRHMRAIKATGNNLVAALDVSDSIGFIDALFPQAKFFKEFEIFYDCLYENSKVIGKRLDYLVVCSPNYLHYSHIAAGLRMGCDVICEKPLVNNLCLLDKLRLIENETGKKIFNILQLRHHSVIRALKENNYKIDTNKKHDVILTYITARGQWYQESWKADPKKSFGISFNIGIHFFDMLGYLFGELEKSYLHTNNNFKASGYLEYSGARVQWFLSIDPADIPDDAKNTSKSFYRNINIDGEDLEFSEGFTDLHEISYREILSGSGFGLEDARPSIATVAQINNMETTLPIDSNFLHPFIRTSLT